MGPDTGRAGTRQGAGDDVRSVLCFDFVPDASDDPRPDGWPREPLALPFLGHQVDATLTPHREFIEQDCKSPASLFVVEAVFAGRALDLKDILTGRRWHVLEQGASRTLRVGYLLFARVVTAGAESILVGACHWVTPASWHIPVVDARERFRPRRLFTRAELRDYDLEINGVEAFTAAATLPAAVPIASKPAGGHQHGADRVFPRSTRAGRQAAGSARQERVDSGHRPHH